MEPKMPKNETANFFNRLMGHLESVATWFSKQPLGSVNTQRESWLHRQLEKLADKLTWKRGAILVVSLFILTMGVVYIAFGTHGSRQAALDPAENVYITLKPGMDADAIAMQLLEHGLIDSKFSFWWQVKTGGVQDKFKAGTYLLHPGMQTEEIIAKLISGETSTIKFTIPEGFGIKEIAERLSNEGLADKKKFLKLAKDYVPYDYVERRANARYAAEGFLFPDTYEISADISEKEIMDMMAQDFDQRLNAKMRIRAEEMNLSIYDLVTLASLVEKEARYAEDRPIIAQVFFKRLRIGMPLQSDTTLQYLLDAPKEDVSIADTKIDSPYNTYQHYGLPPGPIASPGMAAIEAVLYPADTDYLYFVADRQGHNHYSNSYEEHLAIVNQVR